MSQISFNIFLYSIFYSRKEIFIERLISKTNALDTKPGIRSMVIYNSEDEIEHYQQKSKIDLLSKESNID